jgi:hypothetical protein
MCRYFLRKLRKVKKANGQILACNEVRGTLGLLAMCIWVAHVAVCSLYVSFKWQPADAAWGSWVSLTQRIAMAAQHEQPQFSAKEQMGSWSQHEEGIQ